MKTKLLLMIFVFTLIFTLTSTCLYAQSAKKDAAKPEKSGLPSIIKTIDMPWPMSVAVDEKENRVFVISAAGEESAFYILNGRDNSIIKKIAVKEGFDNNIAGNAMAYDADTKRLYAVTGNYKTDQLILVVDTKKPYKILSVIKTPKDKHHAMSLNLSKKRNMIYTVTKIYKYIYAFNMGSNKLADEFEFEGRAHYSAISEDGDFLYITGDRFLKFDTKTGKAADFLPIRVISVPYIDAKNNLIFAASAYKLYIIDLNTFKIKDEREDIPCSTIGGASIALNPSTNHLFVPVYNNSVSVIDAASMKILTTIEVGPTVRSIAVNSQTNKVYVTTINEQNKVVVIQDR